jgi:hypothetical protein
MIEVKLEQLNGAVESENAIASRSRNIVWNQWSVDARRVRHPNGKFGLNLYGFTCQGRNGSPYHLDLHHPVRTAAG